LAPADSVRRGCRSVCSAAAEVVRSAGQCARREHKVLCLADHRLCFLPSVRRTIGSAGLVVSGGRQRRRQRGGRRVGLFPQGRPLSRVRRCCRRRLSLRTGATDARFPAWTGGLPAVREERKTLTRYTIEAEHRHPGSTGDFSGLLNAVATAVKIISNQVGRRAMVGETEWTGYLAAMASEEMEGIYPVPASEQRGKYLLVFDPLDGSSNIDANISVGTIFSILRSPDPAVQPVVEHFLQPGVAQVCAGFALYGASTMLILTTGDGVDGFTLDRDIGAFVLTHPKLRIPEDCGEFAINASNERFWEPPVRRYIQECLAGGTGPRGRDFNMRWIASLVAETYRILTRGG